MINSSPPLKLLVDPKTKPVAVHRASLVPVHRMAQVKANLNRDVALGVLEKVPENTPVMWQSWMHVVPKKDGTCRLTVDLRPLNEATFHQTHLTESPFEQASRIPAGTWKSTVDAWYDYHSVSLDNAFRKLTTFLTPWGRYRYLINPQGQCISGDAYTMRYDKIMEMEQWVRCINNCTLWDLGFTSSHGINQNPTKFVFRKVSQKTPFF